MSMKTGRLSVRFTPEDMKTIDNISMKAGMWSSTWIRHVIIDELIKKGYKKKSTTLIKERTR